MEIEVRCPSCHKLLMKNCEIKCPRCKELVKILKVAETPGMIAFNGGEQGIVEIKKILDKWPAELQDDFLRVLNIFQNCFSQQNKNQAAEAEPEPEKIIKKPVDIFSGPEIAKLAASLRKCGIIPNLKYIREDLEYFKLAFQLVNFFAGFSRPQGNKVPLVNIFGFLHEFGARENNFEGAANPAEAYFMAYWERNMGKFSFAEGGKKVWELEDRDRKRKAIIVLTKKFSKEIQKNFNSN